MPTKKTTRPRKDTKFLKELEDFERRMRERDLRIDALLAHLRELRKRLREIAAG